LAFITKFAVYMEYSTAHIETVWSTAQKSWVPLICTLLFGARDVE